MEILKYKTKLNNYKNKTNRKGFTLIEMVITIVVLAIITAIAIPSVYAYMEKGKQTERDNIARTLFLSAQGQLLEKKVTKSLASFVSEGAVEVPAGLVKWDESITTTIDIKDIKYIVKEKSDTLDEDNPVVKLFKGDVIDEDILKNSICVEFDQRTGTVLSVFYSAIGKELAYDGTGANNISGDRPYTHKKERKQGYYGGEAIPSGAERGPIKISLYDGETRPLPVDGVSNILYAEIAFSKEDVQYGDYLLQILDKDGNAIDDVDPIKFTYSKGDSAEDFSNAKSTSIKTDKHLIYKPTWQADVYIWVIDFLEEDSFNANPFSIGGRYGTPKLKPQDIRVSITADDSSSNKVVSEEIVHSHFWKEVPTNSGITTSDAVTYQVASERHLYNIRYKLDGDFKQIKDIDLINVANFLPISYRWEYKNGDDVLRQGAFSGIYDGMKSNNLTQYRIANLIIMSTNLEVNNIGLFGKIDGAGEGKKGKVKGVSIIRGRIGTAVNGKIGAVAGEVINGGKISLCNSISNVWAGKDEDFTALKEPDSIIAGGLVGSVGKNASIEQSYNGGYYYAADEGRDTPYGRIGVLSGVNFKVANMGGIAGENSGTIDSSYNNARVQIHAVNVENQLSKLRPEAGSYTEFDMEAGLTANMGGLVGVNKGTLSNGYATNFVGKTKQNGIVTIENCSTGGIIGLSDRGIETAVYYLPNGETSDADGLEVSKEELSGVTSSAVSLGSNFNAKARGYKGPGSTGNQFYETETEEGKTTHHNYAYPTLKNNFHRTPWEDIGYEKVQDKFDSNVKYYEIYDGENPKTGGNYGLWSPGEDLLANDKKVLQEGYALFSGNVDIDGNSTKIFVSDSPGGTNFLNGKAGFESSIKQIPGVKCIVFNMGELEAVSLGLNPLYVKIGKGNAGKADYFEGYINPLFAKAIYEEEPTVGEITNYVRSPRHLDNIDFTRAITNNEYISPLSGKFVQDTNVDFTNLNKSNGYKKIKDASEDFSVANIEVMTFNRTAVAGQFKGVYDGYGNGKINSIIGFANTPPNNWWVDNAGIFESNGGTIKGLTVESSKIIGGGQDAVNFDHLRKGIGLLVGINNGTVGGVSNNEKISVTGSVVEGKGSNLGGLAGINTTTGSILNASISNSTVSALASLNYNFGGVVGFNNGIVGTIKAGTEVTNVKVNGDSSDVGGIVGINEELGKIENSVVSGTSITSIIEWPNNFGGIAGTNKGKIGATGGGVAIYNSIIDGRMVKTAGGIAGLNAGEKDSINNAMVVDTEIKGNQFIGGIVGTNSSGAIISNVYISYTSGTALRTPQTERYQSPITTVEDNAGGLVGTMNGGKITNAYMAASVTGRINTIAGGDGTVSSGSSLENVYYLVGHDFNDKVETSRKQGVPLISTELTGMIEASPFIDSNGWSKAKGDYPYPVLKNLPEPKTWCAEISLAYYEKYEGDAKLYKWISGKYNELKDEVVKEDGYAVIGLPTGYGEFRVEAGSKEVSGTPTDGVLLLDSTFLAGIPKDLTKLDVPIKLKWFNNEIQVLAPSKM